GSSSSRRRHTSFARGCTSAVDYADPVDTTAAITINTIALDDVINAVEHGTTLAISGTTTGVENGATVSVTLNGHTYTGTVASNRSEERRVGKDGGARAHRNY